MIAETGPSQVPDSFKRLESTTHILPGEVIPLDRQSAVAAKSRSHTKPGNSTPRKSRMLIGIGRNSGFMTYYNNG